MADTWQALKILFNRHTLTALPMLMAFVAIANRDALSTFDGISLAWLIAAVVECFIRSVRHGREEVRRRERLEEPHE